MIAPQIVFTVLITIALVWLLFRFPTSDLPIAQALNALSGLIFPALHSGRPTPGAEIIQDIRYEATTPPPNTGNLHGEIEYINGDTPVIHWYQEVEGSVYHFVTAGDPAHEAILIVPGLPESWWAFRSQIDELSSDHYVVAIDMKGFGQSDKRLNLDYTNQAMAREVGLLMDKLGIEKFNIMGHDRGAVLTDNLPHVPALKGRILRYVRMQQSFNEPHGKPVPPHRLMQSKFGVGLFRSRNFVPYVYKAYFPTHLTESEIKRLDYEFKFKGTAEAVAHYFKTTNFDIELADRHSHLFESMTMPTLILQAWYDKGQHPEEYARSPDFVANARVQFIYANHFLHMENPVAVNRAIRKFLAET